MMPARAFRPAVLGTLLAATAALGARPLVAQAPFVGVTCPDEFPDCSQLRFVVDAAAPTQWTMLSLVIDPSFAPWRFAPLTPGGTTGLFEAVDDFGEFGGATTISPDGLGLEIDFGATGEPFTLAAGSFGFVQLPVENLAGSPIASIHVDYTATDVSGAVHTGTAIPIIPTVVPEPATAVLVATGAAALALLSRRRRASRGRAGMPCPP